MKYKIYNIRITMRIVYTTKFLLSFKDREECKIYPKGLKKIPNVTYETKSSQSTNNKRKNFNRSQIHRKSFKEGLNKYGKKERKVRKEDIKYNQTKGLLNKLTLEKYATVSQRIARTIKNANKIEMDRITQLIFDKAITELNYTEMYSRLCKYLGINIKPILTWNFNNFINRLNEKDIPLKFVGLCQLIAEQWNYSLLTSNDIYETIECIVLSIKRHIETKDTVIIEGLIKGCCQYIFTLDKKKAVNDDIVKPVIIKTCNYMKFIKTTYYDDSKMRIINSRTMFNIMNTVELFDNNWIPVHKIHEKVKPSTIKDIREGKSKIQERTCSPWKQRLIEKQKRDEEEKRRAILKEKEKDYKISKTSILEFINNNSETSDDIIHYIQTDIKNTCNFVKILIDITIEQNTDTIDRLCNLMIELQEKDIIQSEDIRDYLEDMQEIIEDLRLDIPKIDDIYLQLLESITH